MTLFVAVVGSALAGGGFAALCVLYGAEYAWQDAGAFLVVGFVLLIGAAMRRGRRV